MWAVSDAEVEGLKTVEGPPSLIALPMLPPSCRHLLPAGAAAGSRISWQVYGAQRQVEHGAGQPELPTVPAQGTRLQGAHQSHTASL